MRTSKSASREIGFLLFPNLTQLDLTGPWEVFSSIPNTKTRLIWKDCNPVTASGGMQIIPNTNFAECPQLDLLCIPGGSGINELLTDQAVLDFIRGQARDARYITSVCTGSLVLGAAGLLHGKRAACHWMSRDMLGYFGAIPCEDRVVVDGNVITGGGITAGIDFALTVAADLYGEDVAQTAQLYIEYAPHPPFDAGTPAHASKHIVDLLLERSEPLLAERRSQVERAVALLKRLH
jgi:cyclohexyl-isocyanide hydratase